MDSALFQQLFQRFDAPVLMKTPDRWLLNPAAQVLELSDANLELLAGHGEDAMLWLSHQFYHVSATHAQDDALFILRPDTFFSTAADRVASQLRVQLSTAFGPTFALSENPVLRANSKARRQLSTLNQALYQIFRMVLEFEQCAAPEDLSPQTSAIDLAETFHRLAGELRELCTRAGVKFTARTDLTYLPMMANGKQLELLVLSLVSNSLKNAPKTDGWVSLSLKRQKDQAVITVADNAGGFSPELLTHPLWNEPVRPVPNEGLGLGLPLVQRIVAAHEGALMIEPSPAGTRMVLSLPIHDPEDVLAVKTGSDWDDMAPGFSLAKILLSDVLPPSVYYPDPNGDEGA